MTAWFRKFRAQSIHREFNVKYDHQRRDALKKLIWHCGTITQAEADTLLSALIAGRHLDTAEKEIYAMRWSEETGRLSILEVKHTPWWKTASISNQREHSMTMSQTWIFDPTLDNVGSLNDFRAHAAAADYGWWEEWITRRFKNPSGDAAFNDTMEAMAAGHTDAKTIYMAHSKFCTDEQRFILQTLL